MRGADPEPLGPPPPGLARGAEHQAGRAVVAVKLGADQDPGAEAQLLEVVADLLEVGVVEVTLQRGEQRCASRRSGMSRRAVGDLP